MTDVTKPSPFSPGVLAKSVHTTLDEAYAAIPPGHSNAVILDGTYSKEDGAAVRGMFVHRTEDGWNVVLEGAVDRAHGVAGSAVVSKSW